MSITKLCKQVEHLLSGSCMCLLFGFCSIDVCHYHPGEPVFHDAMKVCYSVFQQFCSPPLFFAIYLVTMLYYRCSKSHAYVNKYFSHGL